MFAFPRYVFLLRNVSVSMSNVNAACETMSVAQEALLTIEEQWGRLLVHLLVVKRFGGVNSNYTAQESQREPIS
jgi:hypothetical protein